MYGFRFLRHSDSSDSVLNSLGMQYDVRRITNSVARLRA